MKAYEDQNCLCHSVVNEINTKYPSADWNCDAACKEWCIRADDLTNNNIEFEEYADEQFGCTCPTCGRFICGWCV